MDEIYHRFLIVSVTRQDGKEHSYYINYIYTLLRNILSSKEKYQSRLMLLHLLSLSIIIQVSELESRESKDPSKIRLVGENREVGGGITRDGVGA